jgi:integrase
VSVGREASRLTAVEVKNLTKPGRYGAGQGLYLDIDSEGVKRWILRYQLRGRRRDMGLGAYDPQRNGLAQARRAAQDAREQIARGIDPIDARKRPTGVPTFAEHSKALIADLAHGWRGAKTEQGWTRSLLSHGAKLGPKLVDQITTDDVVATVKPYWTAQPESGGKLRERVERVLDSARAAGFITGPWENPARWKGHLEHMLSKRKKLTRGHFKALPYADAPAFMVRLRERTGMGAKAVEWAILTAAREGMVIGARWTEIRGDLWIIPASRMKDEREHRVPLSDAALALLDRIEPAPSRRTGFVFKGSKRGSHISNATPDKALKLLKVDVTLHGFRSTFRDWAGDCTEHPREVVEAALAHAVGDAVERAYRRSDALEKRRKLMADWAEYLAKPPTSTSGR